MLNETFSVIFKHRDTVDIMTLVSMSCFNDSTINIDYCSLHDSTINVNYCRCLDSTVNKDNSRFHDSTVNKDYCRYNAITVNIDYYRFHDSTVNVGFMTANILCNDEACSKCYVTNGRTFTNEKLMHTLMQC